MMPIPEEYTGETATERIAAALVEATRYFIEALLEISEAKGPDHEDDLERTICAFGTCRRPRAQRASCARLSASKAAGRIESPTLRRSSWKLAPGGARQK
jgi:hypothetical protein